MEITVEKSVPTAPIMAHRRSRGHPRKVPVPLEAPVPQPVAIKPESYVVFKNAMAAFGGGVQRFEAGTIIDDWYTIQQLKKVNADFIQPMDETVKITVCAHCNKKTVVR